MAQDISKKETTQTAVEWLALRYHHRQGYLSQEDIEQAKQMEKEEIMDAYGQGYGNAQNYEEIGIEQFYDDTYGKKMR